MGKHDEEKDKCKQVVKGIISLKEVNEINSDLGIKIAVFRDCRVIKSKVLRLDSGQAELEYELTFHHEHNKPIGVRVVVAPSDVPDEQLRSIEHYQRWVPARSFKEGVARIDVIVPDRLYLCWLVCCRTYTLRGRMVCRRSVWDRRERRFVICDAPVRGAKVTAFDVDSFWWWCRTDDVGSDFTDINGNFEIKFKWCCWLWRPWLLKNWRLDNDLVNRIRDLLKKVPLTIPIPHPDPEPDFTIFERMVAGTNVTLSRTAAMEAVDVEGGGNFVKMGEELVKRLPDAPDLKALHIWPWWPFFDCKPDIIFKATQDCGNGEETIYQETCFQTRWDINTVISGVTLVANEKACCGPFCCQDPSDEDCLIFHGVGCGGYPIEQIEQDPAKPLVGYARPGTQDRPFGGSIRLRGVFGDASEVDFYKLQSRRISPAPTAWTDVPPDQIGSFNRGHWLGVFPWIQNELVSLQDVGGEKVLKTINRYREENPAVDTNVDPSHSDWLAYWVTATGIINGFPLLSDGVYELRVVGYKYNETTKELFDQQIMALCPPVGNDVDPAKHTTLHLRLDNRVSSSDPGSIHLNTTEPDCDFPDICAVVKNEGKPDEECVNPCGFLRVKAGDTLTIHFKATDSDGHMEAYSMTSHWGESNVFNVLGVGSLGPDPDQLFGPNYSSTFAGSQALYRGGLPLANPEHDRPFWFGGNFKVKVKVDDIVPATEHKVFETCCAYLLRLRVWKRTTNGCTGSYYFHFNHCEFSFTVIREDLIGDPKHPSCSEICPEEEIKEKEKVE